MFGKAYQWETAKGAAIFCLSVFKPNQSGLFGLSIERGGGGGGICPQEFLSYFVLVFHHKSTKHDLKWKLASLSTYRAFEHHPKLHTFVVSWRRSSLLWPLMFGTTILENLWFLTYMDNIYVKWKLKTLYIYIWHQKMPFVMKKFEKNKFFKIFVSFFMAIFFFKTRIFRKIYYTTPHFLDSYLFFTWKKEFTLRLDTPNFITRKTASLWKCWGWIPPPTHPGLIRVKVHLST